jgi:hypothetical protein
VDGVQFTVFGALWVALAILTTLVLVLYRQVEKAYAATTAEESTGLAPGARAPDIEVLTAGGIGLLEFPSPRELGLLAFLTTTCEDCVDLVRLIKEERPFPGRVIGLVTGEDHGEITRSEDGSFEPYWVAHPADVVRSYGVSLTPLVYVVRGRTILASGVVRSRPGLLRLLREAENFEG